MGAVARLPWLIFFALAELAAPPARAARPRRASRAPTTIESRPAATGGFQPFGDPLRALLQKRRPRGEKARHARHPPTRASTRP